MKAVLSGYTGRTEIAMTNGEFLAKLNKRFNEILPSTAKKRTINELIFVLRNDDVEDYNLNILRECMVMTTLLR